MEKDAFTLNLLLEFLVAAGKAFALKPVYPGRAWLPNVGLSAKGRATPHMLRVECWMKTSFLQSEGVEGERASG